MEKLSRSERKNRRKGKASAKKKGDRGEAPRNIRRVERNIGMKTYLHGSMDYAKKMKLRFRVGGLDLPETRKRYTSSREEDVVAHMCPCGTTMESRTHIVGEREIYKDERDALEEVMRKL